jgi:hypothetical protein
MSREYVDALDFCEEMTEKARRFLQQMTEVSAKELGLDPRSFYGVAYVDQSAIVLMKEQDRKLQYYGGFEYVDKDYRREVGDYVFYLAEDDRVRGHLDRYFGVEEEISLDLEV